MADPRASRATWKWMSPNLRNPQTDLTESLGVCAATVYRLCEDGELAQPKNEVLFSS